MEVAAAVGAFAGLAVSASQIYGKLSILAFQIKFARDQILRVGQDISGIEAAINQLTDLLKDKDLPLHSDSQKGSLRLITNLQVTCQALFANIDQSLRKASKQIKAKGLSPGVEITLSHSEQALWPFHHAHVDQMCKELDAVKTTLILVSQTTTLSLVKKMSTGGTSTALPVNQNIDKDDKELLYRAIYNSFQDPQIRDIIHKMNSTSLRESTTKRPVEALEDFSPKVDHKRRNMLSALPSSQPIVLASVATRLTGIPECNDLSPRQSALNPFDEKVTDKAGLVPEISIQSAMATKSFHYDNKISDFAHEIRTETPSEMAREPQKRRSIQHSQISTKEKQNTTDPGSLTHTLLRIMRERPSKLPANDGDQAAHSGLAEWHHPNKSTSAGSFKEKEAHPSWNISFTKHKTPKDVFKAHAGVRRRAVLMVPQIHLGFDESRVSYQISEIMVSQTEIAKALSHWHVLETGATAFNHSEPSQRQAYEQIEMLRGNLLPARFFISTIQYTKPRVFETTAALSKCHDIIVVIEEMGDDFAGKSIRPAPAITETPNEPIRKYKRAGRATKKRRYPRPQSQSAAEGVPTLEAEQDLALVLGKEQDLIDYSDEEDPTEQPSDVGPPRRAQDTDTPQRDAYRDRPATLPPTSPVQARYTSTELAMDVVHFGESPPRQPGGVSPTQPLGVDQSEILLPFIGYDYKTFQDSSQEATYTNYSSMSLDSPMETDARPIAGAGVVSSAEAEAEVDGLIEMFGLSIV